MVPKDLAGKAAGMLKNKKKLGRVGGIVAVVLVLGLAAPLVPELLRQAKFIAGGNSQAAKHAANKSHAQQREPAAHAQESDTLAGPKHYAVKVFDEVIDTYKEAYEQSIGTMTEKLKRLKNAEERSSWLLVENTNLKVELEKIRYSCSSDSSQKRTHKAQLKLSKDVGSDVGRSLASIEYVPPANMQPHQLYTLALSYLKAREDEKAAYLLTHLTGAEDLDTFKTAQNYLLTGVAWYRLKNFKSAEKYFDQVLKMRESKDSVAYQARARLFRALLSRHDNKETKVQYYLTELVDHHPHSMEAEWVNIQEEKREPASH